MNIIVIGDIMLDINYISIIERKAPEADIPIHNINNVNYILGGAANVAQNLKYLDVNVEVISITGNDYYGGIIKSVLDEKQIRYNIFEEDLRKTTQKHRIFNKNVIAVRYDIEDTHDISTEMSNKILNYVKEKKGINAIILSDYNKGLLTTHLCKEIIHYANENTIYTFVDPKIQNVEKYQNCFCFKPNLLECKIITKDNDNNVKNMLEIIKQKINCKNIIITCGENGIYMNDISNHITHKNKINVIDVTGAGDIVLTILAYIYLLKKDLYLACNIANCIAGKSVQTIGNYNINNREIVDCLNEFLPLNKIVYDYETNKIQNIKIINQNKKIVFTNGCFDILHSAHIKILQFAKKQGDILVVGLNSNESIKRLKGEKRPINDIEERTSILSLIDFIDYIIVFNDDTPYKIIDLLRPNIIIKGSDYEKTNVVGANLVNDVILFDYISNKSTSLIINKIIK